ncbi:MAG TPA: hypothetical protein VGD04_09710 [Methylophilus sp.]
MANNTPAKPAAKLATSAKPAASKATVIKPVAKAVTAKTTAAKTGLTKPAVTKAVIAKPVKPVAKPAAKAKPVLKPKLVAAKQDDKKAKPEKVKMERDSFTMPKDEYAQIAALKGRMITLGHPVKKSELLRAGIKLLAAMSDNTLKMTMEKIPAIKTGRPKK